MNIFNFLASVLGRTIVSESIVIGGVYCDLRGADWALSVICGALSVAMVVLSRPSPSTRGWRIANLVALAVFGAAVNLGFHSVGASITLGATLGVLFVVLLEEPF